MKHTLIIVDVQYDFYHPNGALYVKGGENIIEKIEKIIPNFDRTIFTIDFHPFNHCSFTINGGKWPVHCVQFTKGANVSQRLELRAKDYSFYRKGMDPDTEEYGAFGNTFSYKEHLIIDEITEVNSDYVVCGIAGDYCVLETIKNLLKLVPKERVSVFIDGIVSIDGGIKLQNFIKENNLKIYQNDNQ